MVGPEGEPSIINKIDATLARNGGLSYDPTGYGFDGPYGNDFSDFFPNGPRFYDSSAATPQIYAEPTAQPELPEGAYEIPAPEPVKYL